MKRIVSLMLSLIIILSLVCVAAPSVSAASSMATSSNGVSMIKTFEGFHEFPEEDNGQWSVGYGTGVSGDDLAYYKTHGITDAQATHLLEKYLASFESRVNSFIDTHGLKLSQHQFDALVSFTYNCGYDWMNSSTLRNAVINGTTGNDFIYAMALYCKSSGEIVKGLVERRLCEANLYLNAVYSTKAPSTYKYITFDGNLEDAVVTVSIQGYDSTASAAIKANASKSGYRFLGWYTKAEGGSNVTTLGSATATTEKLYAHWQEGDGERNEDGTIKGVKASYSGYAPLGKGQALYTVPGGEQTSKVKAADTELNIVAEYIDENGTKWGQLKGGKWIDVTNGLSATPVYEKASSIIDPITVTVNTNNVNNRIGPGTSYATNGKYSKGEQLILTAVQKGGNYKWGKSEKGWIALQYTDYETATLLESEDATKVTGIGVIIRTDVLNVRAGAGIHNAKVGTYNRGDEVKITLRQKVGTTTWGLTEKGWISLYYANVTDVEEGEVPDIDISGSTDEDTTVSDGTTDSTGSTSTTVINTGKIVNCNTLRIRAGAGTSYAHIGNYAKGTYVNIYETVTVKYETWGRTEKGWIALRYVQLDAATTGEGVTGRIYNCTELNVRAGAGTAFAKVGKLAKGTKVEILEYTKVGKATWGRTEKGWISLYYVLLDAPIETLDQPQTSVDTNTNTGTGSGTGSVPSVTEPEDDDTDATESTGTRYGVTINTSTNGSVTANTTSCVAGTEVVLTVAPKSGYELNSLSVLNTTTNAIVTVSGNKFTMPEGNVNVVATFKEATAETYDVTINSMSNGSITASTTSAKEGDTVTLTITPKSGYVIDELTVKNAASNAAVTASGTGNTRTFTMPAADVTVSATFKVEKFNVTITAPTNGSVSVNPDTYAKGETVSLLITADTGYELDTLTVKDGINKDVAVKDNQFTMPGSNVIVSATFKKSTYKVTVGTVTNGTVTADPATANMGDTVTLKVEAKDGYILDELTVKDAEGKELTVTDNKFTMPAGNVTVAATFKAISRTITVIAVDADGKPVADVPFAIYYIRDNGSVAATGTLKTDKNGKVIFYNGALLNVAKGETLAAEVGTGYAYGWTGTPGGNTVRTAEAKSGLTVNVFGLQGHLDVTAESDESFEGTFTVTVVKETA